jgi:hypothetical protein
MSKSERNFITILMQKAGIPMARGKACEDCGSGARERHHESYDKPLDVVFLCARCHRAKHPMARDPETGVFTGLVTEGEQ